jgi:hypothetical protein
MKSIKKYVDLIEEEIEGAKDYAEKYVECKAKGNTARAQKYKEMSTDELKHVTYIHDMAVQDIEELRKIYTPPIEMEEKWDKAHKEYVESVAWVKQMLTL